MYVRTKTSPNTNKTAVQLIHGYRNEKGQARQRIIHHIGMAETEEDVQKLIMIGEYLKANLIHETKPSLLTPAENAAMAIASTNNAATRKTKKLMANMATLREEDRITLGVHEIYGQLYREMNFDKVLTPSRQKAANKVLFNIVMARLARPESKRASVAHLARNFGINLPVHKVYRMMDKLDETFIERLQKGVAKHSLDLLAQDFNIIYFDCTTLYFESVAADELRQFGFSKDGKATEVQIILALMTTKDGLPVGYEVFPGSLYEGHSYLPMRHQLKARHPDVKAVHVADAGLMNEDNLAAIEEDGEQYIMGAKLRTLPTALKDKIVDTTSYHLMTGYEYKVKVFDYKGRRLVVSYSPVRARKDQRDRRRHAEKALRKLQQSANPNALVGISGSKRYIKLTGKSRAVLDEAKLKEDERWDGLHGVITNITTMADTEVLARYAELWRIEESFRIAKTDLRIRPIFHWTVPRIKAHIAICFMAFSLIRFLCHRMSGRKDRLSPKRIREALLARQCTILRDQETDTRYAVYSKSTEEVKAIYKAMGMKLVTATHRVETGKVLSARL